MVSKESHADSLLRHKRIFIIDFLEKDATLNSACYCQLFIHWMILIFLYKTEIIHFFSFSSYMWKYVRYPALVSCQPVVVTVLVAQGGTATPGTTSSFCHWTGCLKELYTRSTKSRDYIVYSSSILVQLVIFFFFLKTRLLSAIDVITCLQ